MFKRFFAALSQLTANTEAFASSIAEAHSRFREQLALDNLDDVPALPAPSTEEPRSNGRGRARSHA